MSKKPDNPDIKKVWKASEKSYKKILLDLKPGSFPQESQPGTGKTESIVKTIASSTERLALFTSNHSHIEKFKRDLKKYKLSKKEYIHGKGFERSCLRFPPKTTPPRSWTSDERYIHQIYTRLGVGYTHIICKKCHMKKGCEYHNYPLKASTCRISLQPLEFLYTNYNEDKDIFVIDEAISKNENLLWDFKYSKLSELIKIIEALSGKSYELKGHLPLLLEIHRTLMEHTSLIFTEDPKNLFDIDETTFKSEDYKELFFIQKKNLVTHPAVTSLESNLSRDTLVKAFELCKEPENKKILIPIKTQIKKAINKHDDSTLGKLLESYIPLEKWFYFLKVLIYKLPPFDSALILSERLEKHKYVDLRDKDIKIIKKTKDYEWGFIDESPYLKDINSGEYVISNIGKEYKTSIGNPDQSRDSWFTIGHPFLFKVLDISLSKTVILLDATFDLKVFKKIRLQWLMLNTIDVIVKNPLLSSRDKSKIIFRKYKYNVSIKKPLPIENKKTIVYDVESAFPLSTLDSGKIKETVTFIATIIDKNPGKKIAIICKKKFEKLLQSKFKGAEVLHFFSQRGRNIDCDILFVVGTPYLPPKTYVYEYILMFNEFPKSTERRDTKNFTGFKDPLLQKIFNIHVLDEVYHALHRTRLLLYNREAYAMCLLPKKIHEEVTVKKIRDMSAISRLPEYFLIEMIINNEGKSKTFYYKKVKNRKRFQLAGGWKKILDYLLDNKFIDIKTRKSKTKKIQTIHSTKEGRDFYKKYKAYFNRWL